MKISSTTPVTDLLSVAQAALKDVESGEIFVVRDLFRGFEWNRIPRGSRIQLGSVFNAYAWGDGASLVEPKNKTPQNQQQYIKK